MAGDSLKNDFPLASAIFNVVNVNSSKKSNMAIVCQMALPYSRQYGNLLPFPSGNMTTCSCSQIEYHKRECFKTLMPSVYIWQCCHIETANTSISPSCKYQWCNDDMAIFSVSVLNTVIHNTSGNMTISLPCYKYKFSKHLPYLAIWQKCFKCHWHTAGNTYIGHLQRWKLPFFPT